MSSVGDRVMSGTASAIGSVANATTSVANNIGEKVNSYELSTVLKILRFINLLNAVGLVAAGVVNLMTIPLCSGAKCLPTAVISAHLVLFGFLLFGYEARMGSSYDSFLRRQFGFLYGSWGRFFFILFLASLCFGIIYVDLTLWWVQLIVGLFTFANALLNCFVIRNHPGFQTGRPTEEQEPLGAQPSQSVAGQAAPIAPSAPYGNSGSLYGGGPYGQTPANNSGGAGNPFAMTTV